MLTLAEAARLRATPIVGTFLLWHFVKAYHTESKSYPNLVLLFVALPILTTKILAKHIGGYNKLSKIPQSLLSNKKSDILGSLPFIIKKKMRYTTDALDIGIGARLLELNAENASVRYFEHNAQVQADAKLGVEAKDLAKKAKQLGTLFGKCSDPSEIFTELGVKL